MARSLGRRPGLPGGVARLTRIAGLRPRATRCRRDPRAARPGSRADPGAHPLRSTRCGCVRLGDVRCASIRRGSGSSPSLIRTARAPGRRAPSRAPHHRRIDVRRNRECPTEGGPAGGGAAPLVLGRRGNGCGPRARCPVPHSRRDSAVGRPSHRRFGCDRGRRRRHPRRGPGHRFPWRRPIAQRCSRREPSRAGPRVRSHVDSSRTGRSGGDRHGGDGPSPCGHRGRPCRGGIRPARDASRLHPRGWWVLPRRGRPAGIRGEDGGRGRD